MNDEANTPSRPGSGPDLSRRMDRIEGRQDTLDGKITDLASVVARVEQNQTHASELNKLRFDALDTGLKSLTTDLSGFMGRINSLLTGEATTEQGRRMLNEYEAFKSTTEAFIVTQEVLNGQIKLLGRLAVILVGGNILGLVVAVLSLVTQ